MREKKYANVLLEDEEKEKLSRFDKNNNKEQIEVNEDGVKLDLTRELKFKGLQEKIDDTSTVDESREINEDFDLTDTSERKIIAKKFESFIDNVDNATPTIEERDEDKDALSMPKEKGSKRIVGAYNKKDEEELEAEADAIAANKINDDDIYLTTAFKPLKKRFRFSKLLKKLVVLIIILGAIASIGYFVLLPIYKLYINSQPYMVYSNTLDYMAKTINDYVDEIYSNDNTLFTDISGKIKFDNTANEDLIKLSEYTFGFYNGIDSVNQRSEYGYYVKNKDKIGFRVLETDNKRYANFIGSNNYFEVDAIRTDKENEEFYLDYQEYLDNLKKLNNSEIKYLVSTTTEIIKNSLKDEEIKAQKDTIVVRDEEISVMKNTLKLNKDVLLRISNKVIDSIISDTKLVNTLAIIFEVDTSSVKTKLNELLEVKDDENESINIYTKNGTEVVGIDIEENGFRLFYWYKNNAGDFESYINLSNDSCDSDTDCEVNEREIYNIIGIKNSDNTLLRIKYNDEEAAILTIYSLTNEKINLDYDITMDDEHYTGNFLLNINTNNTTATIKVVAPEENFTIELNIKNQSDSPLASMNTPNIIPYTFDKLGSEGKTYQDGLNNPEDFDYLTILVNSMLEITSMLPINIITVDNTITDFATI